MRLNLQNVTHIFIPLTFTAILLYAIGSTASCTKKQDVKNSDIAFADSIVRQQYDSLYIHPERAYDQLSSAQSRVADSIAYYRLELYKSIACVVTGDMPRVDSLRSNAWRFCESAPASEALYSLQSLFWNHTAVILVNCYGNRDSAITCFKNAYNVLFHADCATMKDLIPVCVNLADAYRLKGDASNSSRYYRRALALADSLHVTDENLSIYSGLGQVYSDIENYRDANEYFARAEQIINNDTTHEIDTYSRYHFYVSNGNNLYFQKRYADALKSFKSASEIADMLDSRESRFIADVNLGEVLLMMGNTDSAAFYLNRAQKLYKLLPADASKRFYINSLMGDLELSRNNLAAASGYLARASADSLFAGPKYLALHYQRMEHYFNLRHDYQHAYHCLTRSRYYRDSINNAAVRNQIAEIDMRYVQDTTNLRTNLIISQKDDDMHRMQVQIYMLLIAVIVIVSVTIIYILVRRRHRIENEMKLRNLIISQRLANIRNRISPHFVFNVLNRELAANNEGINNLVQLMRKNLELCDRYTVQLSEEIDFIDTYIANERPSLGNEFQYVKQFDPQLNLSEITILAMMVQIFVENAVKHGLRALKGKKMLRIAVQGIDDNATRIIIENNCPKQPASVVTNNTGTGMRVVTQTVQLLNDYNRNKIVLNVSRQQAADNAEQDIWSVTITIPRDFNFAPFEKQLRQ